MLEFKHFSVFFRTLCLFKSWYSFLPGMYCLAHPSICQGHCILPRYGANKKIFKWQAIIFYHFCHLKQHLVIHIFHNWPSLYNIWSDVKTPLMKKKNILFFSWKSSPIECNYFFSGKTFLQWLLIQQNHFENLYPEI